MKKSQILCISGMIASGKTTLAKTLSEKLGLFYICEASHGISYLDDLFNNPKRWAFETQLAFLCDKAIRITNALDNNLDIIIDRSLYEDIEIFGRHFHETGSIDDRSFVTYSMLANYFTTKLPPPDLTIYCKCKLETVKQRIQGRGRDFEKLYPLGHIEKISDAYDIWADLYRKNPIHVVDSTLTDWRNKSNVEQIINEIPFLRKKFEK